MEWGIVSYIIRYYFNPCSTGSHLYPANTNTLRSRALPSRTYPTLMGLAFGFCLASLVQKRMGGSHPLPVGSPTFRTFFHSHLFCTLIVSHFKGFVKREFFFLRTFFTRCTSSPILVSLVGDFPLDIISIPHPTSKVKYFFQDFFRLAPANWCPGERKRGSNPLNLCDVTKSCAQARELHDCLCASMNGVMGSVIATEGSILSVENYGISLHSFYLLLFSFCAFIIAWDCGFVNSFFKKNFFLDDPGEKKDLAQSLSSSQALVLLEQVEMRYFSQWASHFANFSQNSLNSSWFINHRSTSSSCSQTQITI